MAGTQYPTQTAIAQQQPQTIIVQQPEKEYHSFRSGKAVSTGGTQLVLGVLAIIFQICATAISSYLGEAAAGIWAGFFFLVAGCFGITAKSRKSCCKITLYGIFSFIALQCAIALLILSAVGVENDHDSKDTICSGDDWWNDARDKDSNENNDHWDDDRWDDEWWEDKCVKYNARIAMNGMLILFALIEIVVAIYAIIICLQGCCGGKKAKQMAVPVGSSPGQAVVVYPNTQAPGQYIAYPQSQPMSPPAYDATAPPAYIFYEPGSSQAPVHSSAPPTENYNNPMYQTQPRDNIYAAIDNSVNESKKGPL